MLFKRFYDENLAQASYMIASETSREAIIVDPTLDTAQYVRAAGADRVRIAHVTETHIHADFLSGSRALAQAAGAALHLSAEGPTEFRYTERAMNDANPLRDGSTISFGDIRITAVHTPGHTPEHLTFVVSDLARGTSAVGALSGDFIFVGDVGRPDLLERSVGASGTMTSSATDLFHSIEKFSRQPDHLQIWPGHGAGSACGKSLGSMPQSTLGYEKLFNWAFTVADEKEFVDRVLRDQPVPPRYFAEMKRVNRALRGAEQRAPVTRCSCDDVEKALNSGSILVDTRPAERFATGHVRGAVNIPYNKSFLNWCGALLAYDRALILMTDADSEEEIGATIADLRKIGLDRVSGFCGPEFLQEWRSKHGALERTRQIEPNEVFASADNGAVQIIDVRAPDEWRQGHIEGAQHIPLAALPEQLGALDLSAPIVLHCKGGGRSAIATSFLQANGASNVANMSGGYESWVASGLATVREDSGDLAEPGRSSADSSR